MTIKIRKLTADQIRAAKGLGLKFEATSGSTIEVEGFDTAEELLQEISRQRTVILNGGYPHGDWLLFWYPQVDITNDRQMKSARRGFLTASASVIRNVENMVKVANDPEVQKLKQLAAEKKESDRAIAKAKKADTAKQQRRATGNSCECGCGGTTGGGRFLPGHDAKLKSQLVKAALSGDSNATADLERRGWTKFLEKAREKANRPKGEARQKRTEDDQQRAAEKLATLAQMKEALQVLRTQGRAKRGDEGYLEVTRENAAAIIAGEV